MRVHDHKNMNDGDKIRVLVILLDLLLLDYKIGFKL